MWILKGTLLALWLFGFGNIAWLYFALYRHMPSQSAVDIRLITALTIRNPFWWTALVVCLVLGFAIARSWPGKFSPVFWVLLAVIDLVPAGMLSLFLVLLYKLKEVAGQVAAQP